MSSLNSNHIIIEAKNQYTLQLIDTLAPFIFSGLKSIYLKCPTLKKFQEELTNIPKWNTVIIKDEYDRVIKYSKCDWLDKLIESVFVCNVKILTAINSNNNNVFNVKVPETKDFLHACYIESARNLFIDPYLIKDDEEDHSNKNMKMCIETIGKAIEKTIYHFIPRQEIIEQCLNSYKGEEEENTEGEDNDNYGGNESENESVNSDTENYNEPLSQENMENDDNYKSLNDQRTDILMNKPEEDLGQPNLDIHNEPPILPERREIDQRQEEHEPDTIKIPMDIKKESHNDDYFFSSDSE